MDIRTLADSSIAEGTRVLLRAGLNVPIDEEGNPTDEYRLRKALTTIEWLADRKARTIIVAHLGREGASLGRTASALQSLTTKTRVQFFDGAIEDAAHQELANGDCLLLENIRRETGEETNDPKLSTSLARLGDVFVNDAFADSHRDHASIVGVAKGLPSYAGFLMQEEIDRLSPAFSPKPGSVAIVGGAKFETKEPLITKLVQLYAYVCVGGALANDFLKARGVAVASSTTSNVAVPEALVRDQRIVLPVDGRFKHGDTPHEALIADIDVSERILDAGSETIKNWCKLIETAPLTLWNGPLGVYEQGFVEGTNALARTIVAHCKENDAHAIVGGGDTIAALHTISFDEKKIFCSTGGGAMLQFLVDGTLPGIEVLRK